MLYVVTATTNGRQIPTFLLDAGIQGITGVAHARKIAADILGPDATIDVVPSDYTLGG